MGYGMEFALGGMNGSGGGGGAAADGAGGGGVGVGGDYAGPWGSADPSMNLESLWPQNASGLFDSMLMPGYANSMEMVSGLLLRFRCSLGWKENGTDFVRASFLFFRSARRSGDFWERWIRSYYSLLPFVVSCLLLSSFPYSLVYSC